MIVGGRDLDDIRAHQAGPGQATQDAQKLAGGQAARLGRPGARCVSRVEHVDIDRDVHRMVPHALTDRGDDAVDADAPDVHRADRAEAQFRVLLQVTRGVERTADPNVHAVLVQEQPLLGRAPEGRAVGERRAEVGLPGVKMSVEVDQGDRPEALVRRAEQRIGDGVIAADRQYVRGPGEQPGRALLDLADGLLDVERVAGDVARVRDLLGAERRYPQPRVPRAQQPGTLPHRCGPEPGTGAVGGAAVERDADNGHVAAPDLVPPRQQREGRRPGETRRPARVDGPALGPARLTPGTRRPHLPASARWRSHALCIAKRSAGAQ